MDWRKRVDELRAEPTPSGRPPGVWKIREILRAEGYTVGANKLKRYLYGMGAPILPAAAEAERDLTPSPGTIAPPPLDKPKRRGAYEKAADEFCAVIEREAPRFQILKRAPREGRFALFSDVHIPFHDEASLIQATEEALEEGCEQSIIGGDGLDFYRLSRYAKSQQIRFEDEIASSLVALEWWASRFKRGFIEGGNHDRGREARFIQETFAEEFRFLVKSPLQELILPLLPNVELVGHVTPFGKEMAWLWQLGDAVITHCEVSSAQQGVNLEKLKQWIANWGRVLGINPRPRLITTGHTHRLTEHHEDDCLLIETGTLASWEAQAYQYEQAGLKNRKPGVPGWTLIVQDNGRTNLRETRTMRLGR